MESRWRCLAAALALAGASPPGTPGGGGAGTPDTQVRRLEERAVERPAGLERAVERPGEPGGQALERSRPLEDQPQARVLAWDRVTWRAGRLRVPLEMAAGERVEVHAAGPAGWREAPEDLQREAGDLVLALPLEQVYAVRTGEAQRMELGEEKSYFPAQLLYCREEPGGAKKGWAWVPFLAVRQSPAPWSGEAYATELVAGLDGLEPGQPEQTLPQAVRFELFVQGAGVELEATSLEVSRGGPSGYRSTPVRCRTHDAEPEITARLGPLGAPKCSFEVRPSLGGLTLDVDRNPILGLGLETATLRVTRLADDGRPWASGEPLEVSLSGSGLFPASLLIPAGQIAASGELRSRGIGAAVLRTTSPLRSEPLEVRFAWPLVLLALTLVFGALGAFLRRLKTRPQAPDQPLPAGEGTLATLLVGPLAALVAVAAVATGLATFGFTPGPILTEAGAAVVALIAGYAGHGVFERLARTFGFEKAAGGGPA